MEHTFKSNLVDSLVVDGFTMEKGMVVIFDEEMEYKTADVVIEIKKETYKTNFEDNILYSILCTRYEILVIGNDSVNVIPLENGLKIEESSIRRTISRVLSFRDFINTGMVNH